MPSPKSGNSGKLFTHKPASKNDLTQERLDADLDAFRDAGGVVEKLGSTFTFQRIDPSEDAHPTSPVRVPSKTRSGA